MFQDTASCRAAHLRFVERVIANRKVWYLGNKDGTASACSNQDRQDEEESETTVLMFWSDRAYATRVKNNGFGEYGDYDEAVMDLFDFLFRWLPGMSGDGILAGTNWDGELRGVECDPYELRQEIEAAMPDELKEAHLAKYNSLL